MQDKDFNDINIDDLTEEEINELFDDIIETPELLAYCGGCGAYKQDQRGR